MLKVGGILSYALFFVTLEAARLYSTSCKTFQKSDYSEGDEPYEDDYGEMVCCRPRSPTPTLYSFAQCTSATLNPGNKLYFRNENRNLKYIIFKYSNIPLVPVGVFPAFETVKQLYLNDSNVQRIHPGAFNGLAKLEELYLQNNNITELARGTLNSLSDLKLLNMSNNALTTIEENALLGLFNLNHIDLSHNNLKNLSSDIFNGLPVTFLDLSHNYISEISSNLFLNLSNHDTSTHSYYVFSTLPFPRHALEMAGLHLNLSYNGLIAIDFSYFPESLQNLYLSHNHISCLENMHNLPHLKDLDLSNNQITDILTMPLNLHYLNVSGNRINNLSFTLLNAFQNLRTLDFSFNLLTNLHEDSFQSLKYLAYLYLQNNMLEKLPIGCFRDLHLLSLLNISSNRITEFEFGTFSGLTNLEVLDISNNTMTDLFENTLHSLTSLQILNIGDNFLTTFNSYDLLKHTKNLRTVSLNNNPWNCRSLLKIITNFKNNSVEVLNGSAQKVRNIYGIACLDYNFNNSKELGSYFETPRINVTLEKISTNSNDLETLRTFFNVEFLNSSFFKFFQNYNNHSLTSLGTNSTRGFLKHFDDDFKNTTFYKYFNQDFSNSTFSKSFNKTILRYSTEVHSLLDETLNTSLTKFSNSLDLTRGFSRYFEDDYKNSSFYKYFSKEFPNSGFFKFFNGERLNVINSSLTQIASELLSLRTFFTKEFKNSTFNRLFEQDYINPNFNRSKFNNFIPKDYFIGNSNSSPSFAKLTDTFGQQRNQDILSKIADLQNAITVLMIIVIIILICMMFLFTLRNFSIPLKRSINNPVSINANNKSESTSGLELM